MISMPKDYRPGQDTRHLFDRIAPRYDLLNRLLSFGIDRRWRSAAVRALQLSGPGRILDAATGTGDVALALAAAHPRIEIVGVDQSGNMLRGAVAKLRSARTRTLLAQGSCEALPLADGTCDGVIIAFGIRNVLRRDTALREFHRVLKPGGRLVVLEFSQPVRPLMAWLYRMYSHHILPRVGSLLSDGAAYRYLPDSVALFPGRETFLGMLTDAGFCRARYRDLTGGIVTLYAGCRKPPHE
jgi:demethylmenaquinone methyltransferase/2-methoxy-6-polyprenyl-1,4-benzoquinol methylase